MECILTVADSSFIFQFIYNNFDLLNLEFNEHISFH
jgi:hypothetical protein